MEEKKCIEWGEQLKETDRVCPKCSAEQPNKWLVWVVYALLGLFIIGAIYRIFVP